VLGDFSLNRHLSNMPYTLSMDNNSPESIEYISDQVALVVLSGALFRGCRPKVKEVDLGHNPPAFDFILREGDPEGPRYTMLGWQGWRIWSAVGIRDTIHITLYRKTEK
jgi:hypothetical protein